MDITQAIQRVQVLWRQVEGVRPDAAPNEPTDSADILPRVLTYEATSETDISQMYSETFAPQTGTIRSDLMLSRVNLDKAIAQARAMVKAFLLLLKDDPNLNDTLLITSPVHATFMTFDLGGLTLIGYRIDIDYQSELTE